MILTTRTTFHLILLSIEQAIAKDKKIVAAFEETTFATCQNINPFAMKSLLPALFAHLPVEMEWLQREHSLKCVAMFAKRAPKQLGDALPLVVPELTACMWDTKNK